MAHRGKLAAPNADLDKLPLAEAGVLVYLQRLRADLLALLVAAKTAGHYASIAAISREIRGVLELTSITHSLDVALAAAQRLEYGTVNIDAASSQMVVRL